MRPVRDHRGAPGTARGDAHGIAYSTGVSPRKARRLPAAMPRRPRGGIPRGGNPRGRAGSAGEAETGEGQPLRLGPERIESGLDGEWVVRGLPGAAATKTYRCPGCDQEILPGIAHVVVWPAFTPGVTERRHWHRGCWERRLRRRPPARRGRR